MNWEMEYKTNGQNSINTDFISCYKTIKLNKNHEEKFPSTRNQCESIIIQFDINQID